MAKKTAKIKAEYRKIQTRNAKPVERWTVAEINQAKREAARLSEQLDWK